MIWPIGADGSLTASQRESLLAAHRLLIREMALGCLVLPALIVGLAVVGSSRWESAIMGVGSVVLLLLALYAVGRRNLSSPGHARDLAASGSATDVRRVGDQIRSERALADADRPIASALVKVWSDTYARRWLIAGLTIFWASVAFLRQDSAGLLVVLAAVSAYQYVRVARLGRQLRKARALGIESPGSAV